jgi:DNA polymerase-3 subunit gamma/tau
LGLQGPTLLLASHLQLQTVDSSSSTLKFLLAADDEHLRNEASISELRQSLAAGLQTECRIQIELSHEPLTTPASEAAAADDEKHRQALLAVQQDPAINAMIQAFDAEIVPGSVKPSTLH